MDYKGYDITFLANIQERQEIDEKGNAIDFRDSWCVGDGVYQAHRNELVITRSTFDEIKAEVDRWVNFQGVQITLGERNE
jgi:hypothetical protein